MSSPKNESSVYRHRRVEVLSRDNSDTWFKDMKNWLQGESLWPIVMTQLSQKTPSSTPRSEGSNLDSLLGEITFDFRNLEIRDPPIGGTTVMNDFITKDAKAKYWINLSLNAFDKEMVEDEPTSGQVWAKLLKKYQLRTAAIGRQHLVDFSSYKMESSTTIDEAFQHLNKLGKKLVEQTPELRTLNTMRFKFRQLLSALPSEYATYKAGMDARGEIDPEEGLQILREAERDLHPEFGLFAKKPYRKPRPRSQEERPRSPIQRDGQNCFLCNGSDHQMRSCPYMSAAKRTANQERRSQTESRKSTDQISTQSTKISQLESQISNLAKEIKSLRAEKRSKKAYLAESTGKDIISDGTSVSSEDDQEGTVETATFCKENVSTILQDKWISDSGASSHMTDNLTLFSNPPTQIRQVTITVGGGKLYSNRRGEVGIQGKDKARIILKDVLFVPGLGVNLLSGRKLCRNGIEGRFNDKKMYYVNPEGHTILEAKEQGGVYVLSNIHHSPSYSLDKPLAFAAQEEITQNEVTEESSDDSDAEAHDKKVLDNYMLYHKRFAHLGSQKISQIHKMTTMKNPIKVVKCVCQTCTLTKFRKRKGKVADRKGAPLERVSVDTCGPFPMSRLGNTQAMVIKDDFTRYSWVIPIKDRKECPEKLRVWRVMIERQTGYLVKAFRFDNAGELVKHFKGLEVEFGIETQTTVPHTSTQNGLVERENQQVENDMRANLKGANLPPDFWEEACQAGCYIRNRISNGPEVNGHMVSPYEALTSKVPNVDHVRVWGCKVHSYMDRESIPQNFRRDKLMDKARVGIFMGYVADTSKQFLIWAPDMKTIIKTSNVVFYEDEPGGSINYNLESKHQPSHATTRNPKGRPAMNKEDSQATVPPVQANPKSVGAATQPPLQEGDKDNTWEPTSVGDNNPPLTDRVTRNSETTQSQPTPSEPWKEDPNWKLVSTDFKPKKDVEVQIELNSRKRTRDESGMNFSEDEPTEKRLHQALFALMAMYTTNDDIGANEDYAEMSRALVEEFKAYFSTESDEEIALAVQGKMDIPIPQTYLEAISDKIWGPEWKEAIRRELVALAGNSTWEITYLPRGANLVTSKWVFATKFNTNGSLDKLKARLVARGFSQKFGVDYEHTFAPTLRHDTLRIFLALCAVEDMECHCVDVNNAFTESFLKEDIYMKPPQGVDVPPGMCLKVCRSLYGLKQAARDWNEKCVIELQKLGFVQSDSDPCLLTHPDKKIILLVYVDDILLGSSNLSAIQWFKGEFGKIFKIKDLGEVKKILGVHVTRDRGARTIKLDQEHYIREILSMYNMQQDKSRKTSIPMNGYESLRLAEGTDARTDQKEYQTLVGKLMYLAILTRPDICFALGRLSQFLSDPAEFHMTALRQILKYLRSSASIGITYGGKDCDGLIGYTDSDFASDRTERLSVLGNVFMLANGPVSWMSKKQKSVATSTMDAEYMAMCSAAKQSQWIALAMRDMGATRYIGGHQFKPLVKEKTKFMIGSPVLIRGDNQAALGLVRDAQISDRSKHIDVAYHYQRDLLKKDRLQVEFVGTADMVADGMTKPLAGEIFKRFIRLLGMS